MSIDTDRFRGPLLERARAAPGDDQAPRHRRLVAARRDRRADVLQRRQPPRRHRERDVRARARRSARGGRRAAAPRGRRARSSGIEDGSYGTCVVCGKEIPEERLEAIPYATLCVEASEEALSEPARPRGAAARSTSGSARRRTRCGRSPRRSGRWRRGRAAVDRLRRDRPRGGRGRPADEADRLERARARRGGSHRRPVLDPPRPELRHRLRPLLRRDVDRDRAHGAGRRPGCSSSSPGRAGAIRSCRSRSASCSAAASRTCSTASGSGT